MQDARRVDVCVPGMMQECFNTTHLPAFWHPFRPALASSQGLVDAAQDLLQLLVPSLQVGAVQLAILTWTVMPSVMVTAFIGLDGAGRAQEGT